MALSSPRLDDIQSNNDVNPPQSEESTNVNKLVNDSAQTLPKPVGTALSSVRELLECPVCLNVMYPPIHQCSNGHTICSGCKPRVHNRCPTCRHELGNIRCLALEKVAASFALPCKFKGFGCIGIYPYYNKPEHESQCSYRPYNCPYAGSECCIVGDIPYLVTHLKDEHKVDMHNGSTFNHRYVKSNPQEVENATWMLTVFSCFGQYFCLHFEAFQLGMAPVYIAFLRFMGDDSEAKKYAYSLEVGGNGRKCRNQIGLISKVLIITNKFYLSYVSNKYTSCMFSVFETDFEESDESHDLPQVRLEARLIIWLIKASSGTKKHLKARSSAY